MRQVFPAFPSVYHYPPLGKHSAPVALRAWPTVLRVPFVPLEGSESDLLVQDLLHLPPAEHFGSHF